MISDGVRAEDVSEDLLRRYMYTDGMPDPDLIIRTSGEQRLSNFLIWQAAYAEYYSTPVYWPDFDEAEVEKALEAYASRKRSLRQGSLTSYQYLRGPRVQQTSQRFRGLPILLGAVWLEWPRGEPMLFAGIVFLAAAIASFELARLSSLWGDRIHPAIPLVVTMVMLISGLSRGARHQHGRVCVLP